MRTFQLIAVSVVAGLVAGCGGTVDNSKGNNDSTAPKVNLLITRAGQPNLEVQELLVPRPTTPTSGDYGNPMPRSKMEFSVLATATDPESGIKSTKLNMTRTVCFTSSAGNVTQAYFGTVVRKSATYQSSAAPTQASLGDTGVFDNSVIGTDPANLVDSNLLLRRNNANQLVFDAVGVSTKWNLEATNFAGQTSYSEVIFIRAGDTSCVTQP
jgi:hypothetical protein